MKNKVLNIVGVIFFWMLPFFAFSANQEHISEYDVDIHINPDATITVTEYITVFAANNKIKRGIYRKIPLRYQDSFANRFNLDFSLIEVTRDGKKEPFHIKGNDQEKTIYLGKQDVILPPGEYQYKIVYKIDHGVKYFKDFDELFWNVTGNEWAFPIGVARAVVYLPNGASLVRQSAYTGFKGGKDQNYTANEYEDGIVEFITTTSLTANQGFTVAVAWPKGVVYEPSATEKSLKLMKDNALLLYTFLGVLVIFIFYLISWFSVGSDPKKGTIIPLYEPPEGFYPASVHYINHMGFKTLYTAFTAALVNLAVRGFVKISEDAKKTKFVERLKSEDDTIGPGERAIMQNLFILSDKVAFKQSSQSVLKKTLDKFRANLRSELTGIYFKNNRYCFVLALVLTILFMIGFVGMLGFDAQSASLFLIFWLSMWTIGVATLITKIFESWKAFFAGEKLMLVMSLFLTVFSIPFIIAEVVVLSIIAKDIGWLTTILLGLLLTQHFVFWELMKKPTMLGRKVMDKIDGFKMYLGTANKDEFDSFVSPDMTPELFERFLPYAIALGLEEKWSHQFESTLSSITQNTSGAYHPNWYDGHLPTSLSPADFSSSLANSLSSSMATSASSGSSGSGSGGGGSSGGGGGGGGGGGW